MISRIGYMNTSVMGEEEKTPNWLGELDGSKHKARP